MKRYIVMSMATLLVVHAQASAQVTVRVPFVRVQVGGPGVSVRAPFVNLFVPSGPPVYVVPGAVVAPPAFVPPPPQPSDPARTLPPAEANPDALPPPPNGVEAVMTHEQFVKAFQPKAGNYEVTLLNPVTKTPTAVRFTLPEGSPRRVNVSRREIEFDYGPRRYVKIRFDRDGAEVVSR